MTAHMAGCICVACEADLRAEVVRLREERDTSGRDCQAVSRMFEAAEAELVRLRAENERLRADLDRLLAALGLVIGEIRPAGDVDTDWARVADAFDEASRARAGLEPTP